MAIIFIFILPVGSWCQKLRLLCQTDILTL